MSDIISSIIVGAFFLWVISKLGILKKFFRTRRHSAEIITPKEMHKISVMLNKEKGRKLARELNISNERIEEIETNSCEETSVIFDILEEWKNKNGDEATKSVVKNALIQVGENELATEVFSNEIITAKEMLRIALMLDKEKRRQLARELNLSNEKTDEIETNCEGNSFGEPAVIFDILEEWKNKHGEQATKSVVKNALIQVGEKDVATKVFSRTMKKSKICIEKKNKPDIKKEENLLTLNENPTTGNIGEPIAVRSSASKNNSRLAEIVTNEDLGKISKKIARSERNTLGRELGLSEQKIEDIDVGCQLNKYGDAEVIYKILDKWKQINGVGATREALRKILLKSNLNEAADLLLI